MGNTPSLSKLRHIVIAGGCHVNGWPIGCASSFVQVMLESGPYADSSTIAPINLRNCSSLLCHLREKPADIVILQLGNYETLASIKKHLRSVFHLSHKHYSSYESNADAQINPDTVFPSTLLWRVRVLFKQIYGSSLGHIYTPLFDSVAFRRYSEQLLGDLSQLQACAPELVVFLSPIPCADPLVSHYRCQAARILSNLCSNAPAHLPFRVRYLDTAKALGIRSSVAQALSAGIFADDLHLNRKGHQLLGRTLASILQHDPCLAPSDDREGTFSSGPEPSEKEHIHARSSA